ncbi:MAG: OmpA family protein [Prevotella sp.]|nr:OmpA family protein [Prevotella sp.]
MKKLFLMFAAAMMAASVSAQENTAITANKAGDNWYFGVNAGVTTRVKENFKDAGDGMFKSLAPTFGVRLGKNLTTVFGLAADAEMFFKTNNKFYSGSKTFIEAMDVNLLGTFNLSNLFAGYPGEPRAFELIALGGFGWEHDFNHLPRTNGLNSKVALDFAFNLGAAKAWQLYIEPALTYCLHDWYDGQDVGVPFQYNLNRSVFSVKAGLNYKFGNSNGTHNFAKAQLRDQAEIDALNGKINELRNDVNAKDGKIAADAQTIADLKAKLAACESRPMQTTIIEEKKETILQPMVIFRQGKSVIEPAQYASVEMVAKYMRNHKDAKVIVRGFASPEGNAELNQKLSEARAEAVKTALIKKYKIAADRITTEGLGATDKISEENDFNRVAMFIDTTK